MVVYYKNSKGDVIDLLHGVYHALDADWFDAEWKSATDGYSRKVTIDVMGGKTKLPERMNHLYSAIAYDAEIGALGRLYVNDTYLPCNAETIKKAGWKGYVYSEAEITFHAPALEWIWEEAKSFYPKKEGTDEGLDFPTDFPFDFAGNPVGSENWTVNHLVPSNFEMIIYGPCVDPMILINGHHYQVFTTLEKEEYMVIDNRDCTIKKYLANGMISNLYNSRRLDESVFEPIPSGELSINWSGVFGWDVTLFHSRKEAKW